MNISTLIKAAEYIEKTQKESEHGYALSAPVLALTRNRKPRSGKTRAARSTHNELEKNRRAHLRHCFDELKQVVPLSRDSSRHTTLGLLKQACLVVEEMKECYRMKQSCLRELIREHNNLLGQERRLGNSGHSFRGSHTISESSSCSSSSSGSSGFSEREDSGSGMSNPSDDEEYCIVENDFNQNLSISLGL